VTRARLVVTSCLAALLLAGAAGLLYLRDHATPLPMSDERLMYLRSGRTADRLFLTFDGLAADVYWMRAIQHYGGDRRSPRAERRFELLMPLLDLTTTLDPYFNIAYRFGAIFLSMEAPNGPARPDLAIALLEKGLRYTPDRWQYAHDIGFVHYWHTGDYAKAAEWFDRAAKMTDAPDWTRQLAAVTLVEGGDRTGARQLLTELITAEESYIRAAAERSLKQLRALDAIDELTALVTRYRAATGTLPRSWADMVARRFLPGIPVDTAGVPFRYDPATGQITLSPESELLPLPRGLGRR
jgi:tetratricopeptide (TPR) repeat protein